MRILFVTRRSWPALGGVETYLRNLSVELARSHDVTVLAQRIDEASTSPARDILHAPPRFAGFTDQGVRVAPLELSTARRLAASPVVAQIAPVLGRAAYGRARIPLSALYGRVAGPLVASLARNADVVHSFTADMLGDAALSGARRARRPLVLTPFTHPGQWGDDPASQRVCRRADRVMGLLEADANVYRDFGVTDDRLRVCPICVPPFTAPDASGPRSAFGIEGPIVLFLGRRVDYKGFDTVVAAAPVVQRQVPDVTFVFIGPGDPIDSASAGVTVLDRGTVDDDEKGDWLAAADVVCLPSAAEIFPVSVMEGWSVGTPAVTSDIPPLRELAERSQGSLAVERSPEAVADALVELLTDDDRRAAMGRAGRRFWEQTGTPVAVADAHLRIYDEVRGSRGERS